jgi:hypothetical protein
VGARPAGRHDRRRAHAVRIGTKDLATDPRPFDDAAFTSRLQKLLSLLGSEQPGEADVARRKLLEHLAHHRLSLTDVAARLREPPPRIQAPGFGEMGLERQLYLARVARQEAEFDVQQARQRVVELSRSLQEATIDAGQALRGQARARALASAGWLLAALATAVAVTRTLPHGAGPTVASGMDRVRPGAVAVPQSDAESGERALRPLPGERFGTVLVQDLPIRMTPVEDGEVRAFLNRGTRVVVQRQLRLGERSWLLIRSVTGSGWVPSGDVLP